MAGPLAKVNTDGMDRRVRLMRSNLPGARREILIEAGRFAMEHVRDHAPRDTNRWVAAMMQAGNQAGLGPLPVPEILPSKFGAQALRRLTSQVKFWEWVTRAYEKAGRTGERYYARASFRLNSSRRELDRWDERGVFIGIRSGLRLGIRLRRAVSEVFGGEGRILMQRRITVLVIHNKEPHANLVERNTRTWGKAVAAAKAFGVRRGGVRARVLRRLLPRLGPAGGGGGGGV